MNKETLPLIYAGPLLRRCTAEGLSLWFVSRKPLSAQLKVFQENTVFFNAELNSEDLKIKAFGAQAFVHFIYVRPEGSFPKDIRVAFDLKIKHAESWVSVTELIPDLLYPGQTHLGFQINAQIKELLHGSCRKPHHTSGDALVAVDTLLQTRYEQGESWPDFVVMSGDQVYVDDLCGPMLSAIHQVIQLLGLPNEQFEGSLVTDAEELYQQTDSLYGRKKYLPRVLAGNRLSRLFGNRAIPVITSAFCDNHLISFSEIFALYLLVWSPDLWAMVTFPAGKDLPFDEEKQILFALEKAELQKFMAGLGQVRRLLANLPSYMIFDDHDVTDDWNFSAAWEQAAYTHPISKRMIGNALMAYWICQGWGNAPEHFGIGFWKKVSAYSQNPNRENHELWIQHLLKFEHWHYTVPCSPKLVVLDTRTRRWRSERKLSQPSGLMDWEALMEMQQEIMNQEAVILVSPAPIFGLKLVESLQRFMTFSGLALAVDAENWMAHEGSANTLLHIFLHGKTPENFIILSGDVHYSFAYDIVIRHRKSGLKIWQITASGLKNEFPQKVLRWLVRFNRVFYHARSPLNWFTKRKQMLIKSQVPAGKKGEHVINQSGIGLVRVNKQGVPVNIGILTFDGELLSFEPDPSSPIGEVTL